MLHAREERQYDDEKLRETEFRTPFQRDYDRLLYSSALRRLAGVTQVINPAEGQIFHNRLTHTFKVAQLGRRLAQKFLQNPETADLAKQLGGLDADVVEAACLAHDLGHPPFGHLGEKTLLRLVNDKNRDNASESVRNDGYEGNAQSFRIVTKLALRRRGATKAVQPGLNLTSATLNAILKYPWHQDGIDARGKQGPHSKWGVYFSEKPIFTLLRPDGDTRRTLEAELMDWADDITYALHDLDDFYRAGLIRLDSLRLPGERELFLESFQASPKLKDTNYSSEEIEQALVKLLRFHLPSGTYEARRHQKADLITNVSNLIKDFIDGINLNGAAVDTVGESRVLIDSTRHLEVKMLQHLTWYYVIDRPELESQQSGQEAIITYLFDYYLTALDSKPSRLFLRVPAEFRDFYKQELDNSERTLSEDALRARIAADIVSGMTDDQAQQMYLRITGVRPGSIFDKLPNFSPNPPYKKPYL